MAERTLARPDRERRAVWRGVVGVRPWRRRPDAAAWSEGEGRSGGVGATGPARIGVPAPRPTILEFFCYTRRPLRPMIPEPFARRTRSRSQGASMSKVAVLRTSPETVVDDYGRLMDLAGYRQALPFSAQTCLRINISWHVYMPACSTTPWQMHGVIQKLQRDGYDVSRDLIAAQNDTVVVSCREGTIKNHLAPVLESYGVPIQYLSEPPTEWIEYKPKGKMLVLDRVFEKQGIQI